MNDREAATLALHQATALYTSAHVVDALLNRLKWPACGGWLLDPAAGDGSFLVSAIARLPLKRDDTSELTVLGLELYRGAVEDARARIAAHLAQRGWTPGVAAAAAARIVIERDFLTSAAGTRKVDVIATNPPYLRYARLPALYKATYLEALEAFERADLLHAFLSRCSRVVSARGAIGLICSDRVLRLRPGSDLWACSW